MLVGMAREALGVGLIVPARASVIQDSLPTLYRAVARCIATLGIRTRENPIVAEMIAVIAVRSVETAFPPFRSWRKMPFVYGSRCSPSCRDGDSPATSASAIHFMADSSPRNLSEIRAMKSISSRRARSSRD